MSALIKFVPRVWRVVATPAKEHQRNASAARKRKRTAAQGQSFVSPPSKALAASKFPAPSRRQHGQIISVARLGTKSSRKPIATIINARRTIKARLGEEKTNNENQKLNGIFFSNTLNFIYVKVNEKFTLRLI